MNSRVPLDLNETVRDWLIAHRPADVPVTVPYRAEQDLDPVERPYFVVLTENVDDRSSPIVVGELVLRMRCQEDATAATSAATWHGLSVDEIQENLLGLKLAMQAKGYFLCWLRKAGFEDRSEGRMGREYDQRWRWMVQTDLV